MKLNPSVIKEAYPIRTVAALTGINPITLRTWERRYGLIAPIRTPKGHRLYTKEQIAMLHRVVALVDSGTPISQINFSLLTADPEKRSSQEEEFWGRLIARMVAAISRFEETVLENTYNEALALYPIETVTQRLLLPMLQVLGDRWASGKGMVAEEHFFGVYLRNKLGARFHHRKKLDRGPVLLTACLPGERHEAGILLFALGAQDHGYRTILLGSDMPLEELPMTVNQSGADAIVLAASYSEHPDSLISSIRALVQATHVPVFIGGYISENHSDAIIAAGAIPLGSNISFSFRHIDDVLLRPSKTTASH
jgi:DNA-binding transcriptional MerR regulator/methylmalonyl-CoA mutase cobalamin-binding subunit